MWRDEIKRVGIIGVGITGKALRGWLRSCRPDLEIRQYDPGEGLTESMGGCQAVFICVPAMTNENGQDLTQVFDALSRCESGTEVFVRTTVLPGTCDRLNRVFERRVTACPEFLTERRFVEDMHRLPIISGYSETLLNIFSTDRNGLKCIQMTNFEAELTKYAHNCLGAMKVNFFNIIEMICEEQGLVYERVVEGVMASGLFSREHTQVPGPDGRYGFGGKCFPKDLAAFAWFVKRNSKASEASLRGCIVDNMFYRDRVKTHRAPLTEK